MALINLVSACPSSCQRFIHLLGNSKISGISSKLVRCVLAPKSQGMVKYTNIVSIFAIDRHIMPRLRCSCLSCSNLGLLPIIWLHFFQYIPSGNRVRQLAHFCIPHLIEFACYYTSCRMRRFPAIGSECLSSPDSIHYKACIIYAHQFESMYYRYRVFCLGVIKAYIDIDQFATFSPPLPHSKVWKNWLFHRIIIIVLSILFSFPFTIESIYRDSSPVLENKWYLLGQNFKHVR